MCFAQSTGTVISGRMTDGILCSPYMKASLIRRLNDCDLPYLMQVISLVFSECAPNVSLLILKILLSTNQCFTSMLCFSFRHTEICSFVFSILSERQQTESISGYSYSPSILLYAVPQGSVLSPILFLGYTQPLSHIICRQCPTVICR